MQMQPEWVLAARAAMQATRVPASISLAQFGEESGWGKDMPPGTNNPFGIKAFHGGGVESPTIEYVHGRAEHIDQPFAKFDTLDAAFLAHGRLIATDPRYAPAMAALPDVAAFVAHMAPVYATDPGYAGKLLAIITGDRLAPYDQPPAS